MHCIDLGTDVVPRCRGACLGELDCPENYFCLHLTGNNPPVCGPSIP
jgi:hypothetical protein